MNLRKSNNKTQRFSESYLRIVTDKVNADPYTHNTFYIFGILSIILLYFNKFHKGSVLY